MGCSLFVNCLFLVGVLCGVAASHRLSRLETIPRPIPLSPPEYLHRAHYNNEYFSNPSIAPETRQSNLAIRTETRRWGPTELRKNSSVSSSPTLGTITSPGTKPLKSINPAADVIGIDTSPKLPAARPSFAGVTASPLPYAATPHTYYGNKYIPLRYQAPGSYQKIGAESDLNDTEDLEDDSPRPKLTPVELILTLLRTVLDVVRGINKTRATSKQVATVTAGTRNNTQLKVSGRGFDDFYDEHHYHHETTTSTQKPAKARYTDPWAGYYDFIINEGSFKFWSVFQLFTAALLLYACFSAIYYAKFNPTIPDYDREYDDYFLERTVGRKARSLDPSDLVSGLTWMNPRTFQFIMDAISSHYGGDATDGD